MTKSDSSMRAEDHKLPFKYKGIHEPKGRVKGFRVEIRPPNSNQKIWVGTFDTRDKAMRAFDAAVYLVGKEPYYFVYPPNYFPPRQSKLPRTHVQSVAKKFAEKTDDVKVNPTSCLVDISRVSSVNSSPVGSEQITAVASDVKLDEKLVDEILQNAHGWPAPRELLPPIEATFNSLWAAEEEEKAGLEESEAGVKKAKARTKEPESAAFERGYNDPFNEALNLILDQGPQVPDFPPCIEEFMPECTSWRPLAKRKRDTGVGANIVAENRTSMGLAESDSIYVDDWLIDLPCTPYFSDVLHLPGIHNIWPLETSPSDFDTNELVR